MKTRVLFLIFSLFLGLQVKAAEDGLYAYGDAFQWLKDTFLGKPEAPDLITELETDKRVPEAIQKHIIKKFLLGDSLAYAPEFIPALKPIKVSYFLDNFEFTPDSKYIITKHFSLLINLQTGHIRLKIKHDHGSMIYRKIVKNFIITKSAWTIQITDLNTGRIVHTIQNAPYMIISKDNSMLIFRDNEGIKIINLNDFQIIKTFNMPMANSAMSIDPENRYLVIYNCIPAKFVIINLHSDKSHTIHNPIVCSDFKVTSRYIIASNSQGKIIKIIDLESGNIVRTINNVQDSVTTDDNKLIVYVQGQIKAIDLNTFETIYTINPNKSYLGALKVLENKYLMQDFSGIKYVRDLKTGKALHKYEAFLRHNINYNPEFVTIHNGKTIELLEVKNQKHTVIEKACDDIFSAQLSPNNQFLAVVYEKDQKYTLEITNLDPKQLDDLDLRQLKFIYDLYHQFNDGSTRYLTDFSMQQIATLKSLPEDMQERLRSYYKIIDQEFH